MRSLTSFRHCLYLTILNADLHGRTISIEALLTLCWQRGSLRYLLEWLAIALDATVKTKHQIISIKFAKILAQINKSTIQSDNSITLYDAAFAIMETLVKMAIDSATTSNEKPALSAKQVTAVSVGYSVIQKY